MDMHAILIRSPVNKLAARVVSQSGASVEDAPMTREELAYIVQRLGRKQRLLKRVLNITNRSQHKNILLKANKRIKQFRVEREPRAFQEYRRIGQEMFRLNTELAELRKARWAAADADMAPNAKFNGG